MGVVERTNLPARCNVGRRAFRDRVTDGGMASLKVVVPHGLLGHEGVPGPIDMPSPTGRGGVGVGRQDDEKVSGMSTDG